MSAELVPISVGIQHTLTHYHKNIATFNPWEYHTTLVVTQAM